MGNGHKICVGQFAGAHGVRGVMKLRSFMTEPLSIFDGVALYAEDNTTWVITYKSANKGLFLVEVQGVASKEAADALRGVKLYVLSDREPEPDEGEPEEDHVIGLTVVDDTGKEFGKVLAVHDYGAGVFVEIGTTRKDSFMLPLRDDFIPAIDPEVGRMIIVVPEGWLDER